MEIFYVYIHDFVVRSDNCEYTFYGVNEIYPKRKEYLGLKHILEYELPVYDPFLQKKGYTESSVYLHVYWNKLHVTKDKIGFLFTQDNCNSDLVVYSIDVFVKLCCWLEVLHECHLDRRVSVSAFRSSCDSFFTTDVHTRYIDDITSQYDFVDVVMFRSQCYFNETMYTCERIIKNGQNTLAFKTDRSDSVKCYFHDDIEAEDPRVFVVHNEVYVTFTRLSYYPTQQRCIGITKFNEWNPVCLQVENMTKNLIEKNWTPFVKDDELYFVYNFDPLIIIKYDFNPNGMCNVVFRQNDCTLPIDTSQTYLRGGTNMLQFKDEYYICACHSRIIDTCFRYYTHIVLIDTKKWQIVYLSKPVLFCYPLMNKPALNCYNTQTRKRTRKPLDTIGNTTILMDKSPHIIQFPTSLYKHDSEYFLTLNVRDTVSLLYVVSFSKRLWNCDNKDDDNTDTENTYFDNKTKEYTENTYFDNKTKEYIINACTNDD